MIESIQFHRTVPGPHLLVMGGIHGNEPCGTDAIHQIIREIRQGDLDIDCGTLTFIPICNPQAGLKKVRYIDDNLNRVFTRHEDCSGSIEKALANVLTEYVNACDVLLDLHSMSAKGKGFVFMDYDDEANEAFARALGFEHILTGWPEMFAASDDVDTVTYAHQQGKIAVTTEGGQHSDPASAVLSYRAIRNAMQHLGISKSAGSSSKGREATVIRAELKVHRGEGEGEFVKAWSHLDAVASGDVIAVENGVEQLSPFDGHILLPRSEPHVGDEWYYLGRAVTS